MRPIFTLFAGAAILFCSCSSSHKIQNSEDPGYSSGSSRSSSSGQSDYYSTAPSDNYVRMKTTTDDPRWSQFDDNNSYDNYYACTPVVVSPYSYGFGYSPYSFGYGMYGYSAMSIGLGFWDPYFGWNNYFMWNMGYNPYFYNPYYGGGVLYVQQPGYYAPGTSPATGVSNVYSHLTAFNASTYRTGNFIGTRGRSFLVNGRRSTFSSPSSYNSGAGRNFTNNTARPSNAPTFTPHNTGGNSSGGGSSFGGSSSSGRGFPSGGSFGGGSSFGGRGGFRH